MSDQFSIQTEKLGRVYKLRGAKKGEAKSLVALKDIDLTVHRGELFGLLGPNGAGKTTLIKILTTLLSPTSGRAMVAGVDVEKYPDKVRPLINMVSGGESSGYGLLTVRENLWMFSQFYGIPSKEANARIKKLLDIVGLKDKTNIRSSDLSTGLRQKMNIVRGFMTDPDVLFMDEPSLGLDVEASRDVRHFIREWVNQDQRRTVMLTTHYMVEADELCDRVAIINHGQVLACDKPATLKRQLQENAIFEIEVQENTNLDISGFKSIRGVNSVTRQEEDSKVSLEFVLKEEAVLADVIGKLTQMQLRIQNLRKREPTLEDVFVKLVGRRMEEEEKNAESSAN
jgi:ABC-2 type transport system ATP-binding protein